jgi:hypothetical protein
MLPRIVKTENGFSAQFVGHDDRAFHQLLARAGELGIFDIVCASAALDPAGDPVKHIQAFQGIFAYGSFATQHDGVGLLENGIGDVRDLGPGGHG